MVTRKRNRARILTLEGFRKLNEQIRQRELDDNAGSKLSLEKLGELTGLDPETVKKVVDRQGSDRRTLTRCFGAFGLTLTDTDHEPATQAIAQQSDPNFVGREEAMTDLNALVSRNAQVIVIQARGGVGKTTLARRYLLQVFGAYLEFPIAKETKDIANVESLLEEKLRQLGEEPGREFLVSLDRLKRKLQEKPIGLLIDNLEPALDSAGKFIEPHRRYVELLRVLADPTVQSTTLITSRERLRESSISVQHYLLQSLAVAAWEQFLASRGLVANTPAIAALHKAYGGNAKAMEIVSSAILEDFEGDVEAYWDFNQDDLFLERDLEDLVIQQFDRMENLDLAAYKLLCRMGCYRYQDIPSVEEHALSCLLWDEQKPQHAIKSLKDRSLIESNRNNYWLHPMVRVEAHNRLIQSKDWFATNRKISESFTSSVNSVESIEDALRALEAFYHYVNIEDFERAGEVLTLRRKNKWQHSESLGSSLYRLNLLEKVQILIEKVINEVDFQDSLCELNNILGDIYNISGNLEKGVSYYRKVIEIAKLKAKKTGQIDRYTFVALRNIGLSYSDLWELEDATKIFKEICSLAKSSQGNFDEYLVTSLCLLAFLSSCTDPQKNRNYSISLLDTASKQIEDLMPRYRAHCLFSKACTYINIEEHEESLEIFDEIIENYLYSSELEGLSKINMARAYSAVGDASRALQKQEESLEILESLQYKPDMANAHLISGHIFREIGDTTQSINAFKRAASLFKEMNANKQISRVETEMRR